MSDFAVSRVGDADFDEWVDMAVELWPEHSREEMVGILEKLRASAREDAYICRSSDGDAIGFVNLSVRNDYVEGSTTSPVGYVEGIFVKDAYRTSGVGRLLIETAEAWTRDRGMTEIGSDAEIENARSHAFHEALGFESGRSVWFIKRLS